MSTFLEGVSRHVAITLPATLACLLADNLQADLHPRPRQRDGSLLKVQDLLGHEASHDNFPLLPYRRISSQGLVKLLGQLILPWTCTGWHRQGLRHNFPPPIAHLSSHQLTGSFAEALPVTHVASGPVIA